jgi:hypothetical protein
MTRRVVLIILSLALMNVLIAAENGSETWKKSVVGGINMTQVGFDNWSAGGESSFAWQLNMNYSFVKDTEKTSWSNTGKVAYGATQTGDIDMRKSADEIKHESVMTYKLGTKINPFVAVTGESQMTAGYDYSSGTADQISAFLDPGYFRESFGAGMILSEGISTRAGVALKQTVTTDYPKPYADDAETSTIETLRSEFGAESVTDIALTINDNTNFNSKLELFAGFDGIEETDVKFDNTLMVKISKYLNMNINVLLVYDKDISAKRQIKQSMALGLNYTFI